MVKGLTGVMDKSAAHSKVAATVEPFVEEMKSLLKETKSNGSELSEKQKSEKLKNAQNAIQELAEQLAQRGIIINILQTYVLGPNWNWIRNPT